MSTLMNLMQQTKPSKDYIFKEIVVSSCKITMVYNEVICDSKSINYFILSNLLFLSVRKLKHLEKYLPTCNVQIISDEDVSFYLNNGCVLLFVLGHIYACEVKASLERSVGSGMSELSLMGPKDSFTESFNTNLGLLRRRIKSTNLKCLDLVIGRSSKTKVGILYVEGIVKKDLVLHICKKLEKIDIDAIIDSSYLKVSLENRFQLFPTIMITERPDRSSMALLEGKVVVLVDTSPYVLILPSFFMDYFHTTDDYFQKAFNTSFIRIVRFLAFLIAVFTPGVYIAVTTRNYDLVPLSLLLMLKAGRSFVPFSAPIEALFMILCFEILKESDIRMSTTSGSAISILGGLILGDAAVAAGIVSPIMIIVIAISSIAGLIFSSVELGNAIRSYKLFFLFLATLFGISGVLLGCFLFLFNLFTTEIFGYSYFTFTRNEVEDSLIKVNRRVQTRNPKLTDNVIRGKFL